MRLVKRSGVWHVRIQRGGADALYSLHCTSRREAERAAEGIVGMFEREKTSRRLSRQLLRYALEIARGEASLEDMRSPLRAMEQVAMREALDAIADTFPERGVTCAEAWEAFLSSDAAKAAKPATMEAHRQHWEKFADSAKGSDLAHYTEEKARRHLESLEVSAQTWNNHLGTLSLVFRAANLPLDWSRLRRRGVEHAERTLPDMEQARRLLAWLDANPGEHALNTPARVWAAWCRVLYYTGLRPVDAVSLNRSEIVNGMVELMPEKTSRTRRKVSFAASPALLRVLESLEPDAEGWFFPSLREGYLRRRAYIAFFFGRLCRKAGVEGLTPYSFRHNFVTTQIDSGASEEDVAAAVGHSDTSTTEAHYYHGRRGVSLSEMPEI